MSINRIAFIALWLFIFSMPWERAVAIPGVGGAGTMFGLVAFAAGAAAVFQGGKLKARVPSLFMILFAFFVFWTGLSFFWAINPDGAQTRFQSFLQFLIMMWLIWELCRTHGRRLSLLQAYVWGSYVVIAMVIYNFVANPFVPTEDQNLYRYTGINDNPNSVATLIALGIAMSWYLAMNYRRGWRHWTFVAYVPLSLMAIGLIASRGGMLCAVVALALIPLSYGSLSVTRRVVLTLLIGVVSVVGISAIPQTNLERLSETGQEITEGNVSNRAQIWEAGFVAFWESPFIGIGAGGYSDAVERVRGFGGASHSAYFAVLTELGLIGFVLFGLLLVVPVLPLFKLNYLDRTFYFVLWFAILVAFIPGSLQTYKVPWFLMALFTTHRAYVVLPSSVSLARRRNVQSPQPQLEA